MLYRPKFCEIFKVLLVISVLIDVLYVTFNSYIIRERSNDISPSFSYESLISYYGENNSLSETIQHRPRIMLLWTKFWGLAQWFKAPNTIGPVHFREVQKCPEYRCILTNNRNFLPSVDLFDAVIFHTAEPWPQWNRRPAMRKPHQIYVFATREAPGETRYMFSDDDRDYYNITMTYRLDSDVIWISEYVADVITGEQVAPAYRPNWKEPPVVWNDTDVWNRWPNKTKLVAWFVSHCITFSRRENFVNELQQYIAIDVFGKCGNLSCERYSIECDEMLDRDYKFYLAFENSLCTDYVTEKAFRQLNRLTIPIVLGGANYTRFLPPHSYINAESFGNVEGLANYLKQLANDPIEYMSYFWYRRYYKAEFSINFCNLCALMTKLRKGYRNYVYTDIEKWWRERSCRANYTMGF